MHVHSGKQLSALGCKCRVGGVMVCPIRGMTRRRCCATCATAHKDLMDRPWNAAWLTVSQKEPRGKKNLASSWASYEVEPHQTNDATQRLSSSARSTLLRPKQTRVVPSKQIRGKPNRRIQAGFFGESWLDSVAAFCWCSLVPYPFRFRRQRPAASAISTPRQPPPWPRSFSRRFTLSGCSISRR